MTRTELAQALDAEELSAAANHIRTGANPKTICRSAIIVGPVTSSSHSREIFAAFEAIAEGKANITDG